MPLRMGLAIVCRSAGMKIGGSAKTDSLQSRKATSTPPSISVNSRAAPVNSCRLPHPATVCVHHRLPRLAVKRLLKLRHVGNNAVRAIFLRRVRIDCCPQALAFFAHMPAPALSVTYEESLLWREAIDRIQFLCLSVVFPSQVSEQQSS